MAGKIIKKAGRVLLVVLLVFLVVNILVPAVFPKPDAAYEEELEQMDFESPEIGRERVLCIDGNEDALLWRLRMIDSARESVIFSTFDLRTDDSGMDILSALFHAAERGVRVRILVDGIYQVLFLQKEASFQALAAHDNVEVRIYNPIHLKNSFRLNYRMHDKYLIIDHRMYLLGGRNTNDIFLGKEQEGSNIDRDLLVYDTSEGKGESLLQLEDYFEQIWNETCVSAIKGSSDRDRNEQQYRSLGAHYEELKLSLEGAKGYDSWYQATKPARRITLIHNGTQAGPKAPRVLQTVRKLAETKEDVMIQTPYVICNSYMYRVLEEIASHGKLRIILNAVEKGSNPWGCTDYLNHKTDILNTGADVYELMNEYAVHTKTILMDQNISLVGSYNLDMRSTYLDTELMLVVDSEELNHQIRELESLYMSKSREVTSDGRETDGRLYTGKELTSEKKRFYGILRVIIRPFRHLL